MMALAERVSPLLAQLRAPRPPGELRGDLGAGVTVGVMLIPQGMAYAMIAGVPPIYGLYSSLVPILLYALFGSSRQVAVGPVAIVSLLVATGVAPLAQGDPQRAIELSILLSAMVGILLIGMGLLRFGILTHFLSHPVLTGFTSAAALVIGASQLQHLLGIPLPGSNQLQVVVTGVIAGWDGIQLRPLLVGGGSILLLLGVRRWSPIAPGALIVVALTTTLSHLFRWEEAGLRVVGEIPRGLPTPALPLLEGALILPLFPAALTIALIGFMESVAVAKVHAAKHRYRVDPDRELLALGMANLGGSLFRAFPTTGGFSRTAVNDQAGARSGLASLVSASVVALTLLFLTDLFSALPNAVLAAIILVAVSGLVDHRGARKLWEADRRDFFLLLLTFAVTLTVGIEAGILTGVVASLGALIYDSARPHSALLGQLPGTDSFRNLHRYPDASSPPGIVILRIDAALSFANADFLRSRIEEVTSPSAAGEDSVRALVLDFHAVNGLDSTAMDTLREVLEELSARGIELHLAGVKGPVMDRFRRSGFDRHVGVDRFHLEVAQATRSAQEDRLELP